MAEFPPTDGSSAALHPTTDVGQPLGSGPAPFCVRNYGRGAGKTPPTVGVTLSPNGSGGSLDSDAEETELL